MSPECGRNLVSQGTSPYPIRAIDKYRGLPEHMVSIINELIVLVGCFRRSSSIGTLPVQTFAEKILSVGR